MTTSITTSNFKIEPQSARSDLTFAFSWLVVMIAGLAPIGEATLHRSPSITVPTMIAFFIAVASGIALRRRYSWFGIVLHIYGQIAVWLSLFVMSLALVLFLTERA